MEYTPDLASRRRFGDVAKEALRDVSGLAHRTLFRPPGAIGDGSARNAYFSKRDCGCAAVGGAEVIICCRGPVGGREEPGEWFIPRVVAIDCGAFAICCSRGDFAWV